VPEQPAQYHRLGRHPRLPEYCRDLRSGAAVPARQTPWLPPSRDPVRSRQLIQRLSRADRLPACSSAGGCTRRRRAPVPARQARVCPLAMLRAVSSHRVACTSCTEMSLFSVYADNHPALKYSRPVLLGGGCMKYGSCSSASSSYVFSCPAAAQRPSVSTRVSRWRVARMSMRVFAWASVETADGLPRSCAGQDGDIGDTTDIQYHTCFPGVRKYPLWKAGTGPFGSWRIVWP